MIDGLKLTISGKELRGLLDAQIQRHERHADRWTREQNRTPEEQTEDEPLLPEDMCRNESERHAWRAEVLGFIRDHVEADETYRLGAVDLDFGELLPTAPGWLTQDEYEERTRIGFALERMTKAVDGIGSAAYALLASREMSNTDVAPSPSSQSEETDEYRTTRLDIEGGPEVVVIERK